MLSKHFKYSIEDFLKLYENSKTDIPKKTLEAFKISLKRIEKVYGHKLEKLNLVYILKPNEIIKKLKDKNYSFNSIYATLNAIGKLIGLIDAPLSVYNQIKIILQDLRKERTNLSIDNIKTIRESSQWIDFDDMVDKVNDEYDNFIKGDIHFIDYRNFLMLSLFILQVPVRIGNYLNLHVINDEPKDTNFNYLVHNNSTYKFIFNKFKTSKFTGSQELIVKNDKLINLLDLYFLTYRNDDSKYLFHVLNKPNREITQQNFSSGLKNITNKLFHKEFSIDIIRHSYITSFYKKHPSIREKLTLASSMNHSIGTQNFYFRK